MITGRYLVLAVLLSLNFFLTEGRGGPFNWPFRTFLHGGDGAQDSKAKPEWLEMDKDTVEKYLNLAKHRHAKDVKAARSVYWYAKNNVSFENDPTRCSVVELDTYGVACIQDNNTWALPDFASELNNMIFVTRGAAGDDVRETPLFQPQECDQIIKAAEDHFAQNHGGEWTRLPSGQYDVAGFWIKDVPEVHDWFNEVIRTRMFPLLAKQFPDFCSVDDLVVDNAYLFKYTTETGKRTGVHTDSGCLSFTIALGGTYEGGGTWIEGLSSNGRDIQDSLIEMRQGHVTVRPGGVRHCGHAVTSGTRYIIGGFCMHSSKVESVRMLIGLGSELVQQGEYKEAQEALTASLMVNPRFDGAYTHLADALQKQGKLEEAVDVLEHCLQHVNPCNGEVAYSLGVLYLELQDYLKAKEKLKICLDVDDGDESAMMALAQVCAMLGDTDGERSCYEKVIQMPGLPKEASASAYCNLGVISRGDYEMEVDCYKKALSLVPNNFQSRFSLAAAYAMQKQWTLAAESFRLAVELASTEEHTSNALNALYKVAVSVVNDAGAATREEQMLKLYNVMGKANFQKLMSMQRGQS